MKKNTLSLPFPDFTQEEFTQAQNVKTIPATADGIAPGEFFLTPQKPCFYKIDGQWKIPDNSFLNGVVKIDQGQVRVLECYQVKKGDEIVQWQEDYSTSGIYVYNKIKEDIFPSNTTAESSSQEKYQFLVDLMREEKENGGHIMWVMGPSVIFDYDSRFVLSSLAREGYVQSVLGGNAMMTHDLEGGYLNTALGQNIYTQKTAPNGHYNHLDLLNAVRRAGSIQNFIDQGQVKNGFVKTIHELGIPFALAGSIRDDGPLPEVHGNIYEALEATKELTNQASLVLCLATILHSISTANITSTYRIKDQTIHPVTFCAVDIHENITHKVSHARDHVATIEMITNVQDFLAHLHNELVGPIQRPEL